ncbi:hypothetical protein MOQ72_19380 [Saccharopolyspora sp. K220]|uniref:hypothetical protein n=1 Tax=Saccharopolyspora soli TaxID=2926618 RepID=UPI001F578E2B|nr:hypothetical protein [Saccharopolyspora soli]MCI2419612.1 hypothetical protein [Saccharopolyspora soli]
MIWLTWRQHRFTIAALGVILVGFAGWLLFMGNGLRESLGPVELADCIGIGVAMNCGEYASSISMLTLLGSTLLPLLPALIGAFVGAPMLSREFEQRTFRYAWTQGISREHWLFSKVFLLGGVVVALSAVFSGAYMWFYQPAVAEWGRFDTFTLSMPVFPAMCLFGFALGVIAGTLFKHLLIGMAVSLAGFLAVLLPVVGWLRAHYMTPERITPDQYPGARSGWLTSIVFRAPSGAEGDVFESLRLAGIPYSTGIGSAEYEELEQAGFTQTLLVQPSDRFWTFQFIESGIFLALTAVCVSSAIWLLRRKNV